MINRFFAFSLEAYTDLDHANYLIAGLLLLVMIVLAIWIKFFVSWKRALDSKFHGSDLAPMNNHDPDEGNVEKDEPYRDISAEDKKEDTIEDSTKSSRRLVKPTLKQQRSYINNVNVVMLNRS